MCMYNYINKLLSTSIYINLFFKKLTNLSYTEFIYIKRLCIK